MKIAGFEISFKSPKTQNLEAQANARYKRRVQEFILAAYDAAQTNNTNSQHWLMADDLSPDDANSPEVRETIRNRARYEFSNSSYLKGITKTERNFIVGTGPRIQMKIPADVEDLYLTNGERIKIHVERNQLVRLAKDIRAMWNAWSREIKLSQKLRLMVQTAIKDGEVFAIMVTRKKFKTISLGISLKEAQFCTSALSDRRNIDGVQLDAEGDPEEYTFITDDLTHKTVTIKADYVIHLFEIERPEEHRGISQTAAGLPIFSQLRDYTLSVGAAARLAADMAMYLKVPINEFAQDNDPTVGSFEDDIPAWGDMPLKRAGLNILPRGTEPGVLKAEQPVNTYPDFKAEMVNEYGRGRNLPYNVAAGNSKEYNYASGRLDYQFMDRNVTIKKDDLELDALDSIYEAFHYEISLLPRFSLLRRLGGILPYSWIWDGVPHVDPVKAATARSLKLKNGSTTESREAAKDGLDWEEVQEQRAVELANKKRLIKKHGLTIAEAATLSNLDSKTAAGSTDNDKEEKDDE